MDKKKSITESQHLSLGQAFLKAERLEEAASVLEEASQQTPSQWESFYWLGCVYGQIGDYEKAESNFSRVISINPSHAMSYLQRGHARLKSGKLDTARQDYQTAERLGFGTAVAPGYECLGLMYSQQEKYEPAHQMLARAAQFGRLSDAVLFHLGWLSCRLGRMPSCVQYWSTLQTRYPHHHKLNAYLVEAKYLLGIHYAHKHNWNTAIKYLTEYLHSHPNEKAVARALAEAHFHCAAWHLLNADQNGFAEAQQHLETVQRLTPEDDRPAYYRVLIAAQSGNTKMALRLIQETLTQRPRDQRRRYALALLLFHEGERARAQSILQELAISPTSSQWNAKASLALAALQANAKLWFEGIYQLARQGFWQEVATALHEVLADAATLRAWLKRDTALGKALAAVYLLSGQRENAMNLLEQIQHSNFADTSVAHACLVINFWSAVQHEATSQTESSVIWRKAIGNAVLMLYHESFWKDWQEQCAKRYQSAINSQAISEVRSRLEHYLINRMPLPTSRGIALHIELAAARTLKRLGGFFVLAPNQQTLICGPAMLRCLGHEQQLGDLVKKLLAQQTAAMEVFDLFLEALGRAKTPLRWPDTDEVQRLLRYFSCLAEAQALLEHGWLNEARAALEHAGCEQCASESRSIEINGTWLPCVCRETCDNFARDNPAYAGLDHGRHRLWQEANRLAAEVYLAFADAQITATPMNVEQTVAHWKEALRLAQLANAKDRIQGLLAKRVVGRTSKLDKQDHINGVVQLLDNAYSLCEPPFHNELGGWLSEALNYRGVAETNRPDPDWQAAVGDFRRSVELNPHIPPRHINLIISLRRWAMELSMQNRRHAARLLLEAGRGLEQGLREFQGEKDFAEQETDLKKTAEAIGYLLNSDGVAKAENEEYEEALEDLQLAYELAPQMPQPAENICQITEKYVLDLAARKQLAKAAELLNRALQQFPHDRALLKAKATLQSTFGFGTKRQ